MIDRMVMELKFGAMEVTIMETLWMVQSKLTACTTGQTVADMKENGLKTR